MSSSNNGRLPSAVVVALRKVVNGWTTPGAGRVTACAHLVGVIAGLGAVAFLLLLQAMYQYVLGGPLHFQMPPTGEGRAHPITYPYPWWLLILIPAIGGLISGLIVFTFAPEAEGHGTDALIRAFHRGGGVIRARVPFIKSIASIITIGTGGSAGQEGPIAQIGAGFGSYLAKILRLTTSERRLLTLAGAAGGVGAIFRAPLGGALFAVEVLYMTTAVESDALIPCLASSIVAYSTFALFITPKPIFVLPVLHFRGLEELPLFAMLALICVGVGWFYVRVFYGMRDRLFHPLRIPRHLKPALGGLALGVLALKFPQLTTGGYGWVQWGSIGMPPELTLPGEPVFVPHMGVTLLFALALLKIFATGLTISSGGSGGVFGPSVFIGGMLGGAFGQFLRYCLPSVNINPAAYALVGMGGFFAGVAKCPLTSIVMVCEMTGSYNLLVPLMLVCGMNVALSKRWTLYEEQVPAPFDSPAHQGDFVIDVLERLRVGQVAIRTEGLELIPASLPFDQVVARVAYSTESLFPVVDAQGRLTGLFTLRDIRPALLGSALGPLVLADDIAIRPPRFVVSVNDDLHTALRRMTDLNTDAIPVVREDDSTRLVGLLGRREIVAAYSAQIETLRGGEKRLAESVRP